MRQKIVSRYDDTKILYETEADTLAQAVILAVGQSANLRGADLYGANQGNPATLLTCEWGDVSDSLCVELMVYDASNHPDPKRFNEWAKTGRCPFEGCQWSRAANFTQKKELWKPAFLKRKPKSALWLATKLLEEKCKKS